MEGCPEQSDIDGDALAEDVSGTGRILFSAGNVTDTLARLVELAVAMIEGCDFAGIFLIDRETVATPAHTDPIVAEVNALQHENSEGPCLDAITDRIIVYANDLRPDLRWPSFAQHATAAGLRSVVALPLSVDSQRGALNLYARHPDAFGVDDQAEAVILASLASMALATAPSHEDQERRAAALETALASRQIVGEATGILMERERISEQEAFDILRRASQHLHVKVREVAQSLIDTGEDPDTG